ncbi:MULTISPECIES: hypothetical protein [Paenibacillus]|uniref:hypothetical protein n=1 Tax=Paenibacillus TaxID=44249 RepID=UPI0022B8AF3D|nr:hypothetical protein [Paenibacillus caseinilyticus]MCZ8520965.1 hypothetical protein [Paenibacillus caseinilyticus]
MRADSNAIMNQLLNTQYIDAKLKMLVYDHASHIVRMTYGDPNSLDNDVTVVFQDCFSAQFNTWLDGMKGRVPKKPGDLDFFFHDISIQDIEINGVELYKCSMVIPMMDCLITCLTIDIED